MKLVLFLIKKLFISRNSSLVFRLTNLVTIISLSLGVASLNIVISSIDGFESEISKKLSNLNGYSSINHLFEDEIIENEFDQPFISDKVPYLEKIALLKSKNDSKSIIINAYPINDFNKIRLFNSFDINKIKNDLSQDYRAISEGTKDYILKSGFNSVIIGLSGGIDSALVATIAVDILGKNNVSCVKLPSDYTSKLSLIDADQLIYNLDCKAETISISEIYSLIKQTLLPSFRGKEENETEENIQSRIRGLLLMALSNKYGSMLLTTGNKSEIAVGYSTIYGDMCGGYNPIKDLYKTRLYSICEWRNSCHEAWMKGPNGLVIPKSILEKSPTAELRPNQTDQDSFCLLYTSPSPRDGLLSRMPSSA